MNPKIYAVIIILPIIIFSCADRNNFDPEAEKTAILEAIENSIGWALDKDLDLLYNSLVQDTSFFIYHPDSAGTITGFEMFKEYAETNFMDEDFRATDFNIRKLRINLSRSGETAWYSCLLDDFGEYKGQRVGWVDCRWTGVLEKRAGKWLIAQMHFSFAK